MIISVHIRKNAGQSFRAALQEYYGDRLYLDYGDLLGASTVRARLKRLERKALAYKNRRRILQSYNLIHGHFFADKYKWLSDDLRYATVLRNPVDRVLSNYHYLVRNPGRRHPNARLVHTKKMTLEEYVRHPEARNVQARFLKGVPLEEFAFVGLCEDYEKSVALFNAVFHASLRHRDVENVNPERGRSGYDADPQVVDLIREHNERDVSLYERGVVLFNASLDRWSLARDGVVSVGS